ncbi:MAG TPA: cofactor-independent phosphoglycerate mutase [Desulfohalobiaceae bacterium]|nr:cofactor-independent phosphoglycerate mutase [Desulfohalobiaceae bacterium]
MKQKLLFLIADGMGDYPISEIKGKTPLEMAHTPNIDSITQSSILGQCVTVPESLPPGSDIANMALLGYNPLEYHTGRGPIEASAQQLDLDPSDLIYRLNLCTISELSAQGIMLDYCAGHIATEEARKLIDLLKSQLGNGVFEFITGLQYRHLLVQKNGQHGLEAKLNISPPHDLTNQSLASDLETFAQSDSLKNLIYRASELLQDNYPHAKANAIWPWGQGSSLALPNFQETFGYKGAVISAVDLIKGLGRSAGLEVYDIPGATGLLDTNYQGKVEAAQEFLEQGQFLFLHVEGPDECGHAGNLVDKIEAIQRFDHLIVGPLLKTIKNHRAACLIACDHLTPIIKKTHTSEPVPFLFYNPRSPLNHPQSLFCERTAAVTGLTVEKGYNLLPWVLSQLGEKHVQA